MDNTEGKKTEEAASQEKEPTESPDSQVPPVSTTTTTTTSTTTAGKVDDVKELQNDYNQPSAEAQESGTLASDSAPVPKSFTQLPELDLNSISNRAQLQEMETTELRVKIICLEKNNMALKMELQCAELQMQAKMKVDVQKTRLIELLDGKVTSLEKKNIHLMDMLEGLLKQKDTHSHRLIEATQHMENLAAKLADSERMRTELRNMNQELKTMLGNIEDKGSQIAKMAKEKILKYKEETEKIQQQLDDMKKSTTGAATPEEAGAADGERTDRFQQNWKKIEDLQQQLANAFQSESTGDLPESLTSTNNEIKQELEQLRAELNTLLDGNQGENDRLRSELDSMRLLVADLQHLSQDAEMPVKSVDAIAETNTSDEIVAKDLEISQLKEKLGQLNSTITKLADLSAASSTK